MSDALLTDLPGSRSPGLARTRLAMIYGSVKPRFCGVEAATVTMHSALEQHGIDVEPVSCDDWGAAKAGNLIQQVSALRPDAIFIAYPTLAFDRKLGPVVFSLLQRIAPLIVVLHEFNHVHVLRRLAISALVLRARQVVVTTDAEKAGLVGWNPWLRRRVDANPIPTNIPQREWRPDAGQEVTILSQLRPDKGLESFLACCKALARARPDLTFRIVGSEVPRFGRYADQIRRTAAAQGVVISENLSNDMVAETLSRATVALLPFPDGVTERRSSLIAAAMCGVPIVTTMGQNTPADLAQALEPLQDEAGLVERTLRYCDNPQAREAAHQRSLEIAEKFNITKVMANLAMYVRRLNQDGPGRVPARPQAHRA